MECGFASIAKQKAVANGPTRLENIAEDEDSAAHPRELLLRGAVETPTGECQREEEGVQMVFLFGILYLVFYVQ